MNLFHYAIRDAFLTEEKLEEGRRRVVDMNLSNISSSEIDERVGEKISRMEKQRPKDDRFKKRYFRRKRFWDRLRYLLSRIPRF